MRPFARRLDGKIISPQDGVVPIMKEIERGKLQIVGTGFYVTRYGLFITAQHVLNELVINEPKKLGVGYILHIASDKEVHLRRILGASLLQPADLALCQAENFVDKYPDNPLLNLQPHLTTEVPYIGSPLITYAYPANKILDFTQNEKAPEVCSDYFEGKFLEHAQSGPFMPYPHFRTSIKIKGGASGGPVFSGGRVIGVNCRGWDFGKSDKGENLSSIVPVVKALQMLLPKLPLPEKSWEYSQIPDSKENEKLITFKDLARFGHVEFDPPIIYP